MCGSWEGRNRGRIGKQAMTIEWYAWLELSVGCASCA